jgi:type I restriction enzyme S subunit
MVKQRTKAATPRLRFPEFLNADGWPTERMDRLYSFGRNNTLSRDKLNYVGGTAKNIHYGDIHTKFPAAFDVSRERVPFVNDGEALPELASGDYCVEGDLIFADASEDMNDVGKTMEIVRLHGERVLAGQHTILARQLGGTFVTGFGAYLFGAGLMRGRIKKEAQGTKVYQISAARLGGIDVTYPNDKSEQHKIADCLTSLDEVIAAQGRKVEALKAHKRGLMQQIFPREGETRPRFRFPEFRNAAEWEATSVGDWSKSFSGGTPPTTRADYYGGDIPFIRSAEIGSERTELFLTRIGLKASSAKLVDKGDVLLALYGANSGDVALAQTSGAINQAILCIRPDGSKAFLYHYLTGLQPWLVATFLQGGQGNLSGEIVKSVGIRVPSSEEQQCIADFLTSLDTRLTAETARLTALKTHKQGLMQQLFPAPEATDA